MGGARGGKKAADLFNREGENKLHEHAVLHINKWDCGQGNNPQPGQWAPVYKYAEQHRRDQRPRRSRTAGKI